MKNPQFLPNQADILPSEYNHWTDILTKFHRNWTKIVDFLVIAFYFPEWTFFWIWSQCDLGKRPNRRLYPAQPPKRHLHLCQSPKRQLHLAQPPKRHLRLGQSLKR